MRLAFAYRAVTAGGQRVVGTLEAESRAHAVLGLKARGLTPLDCGVDLVGTARAIVRPKALSLAAVAECFGAIAESLRLELPIAEVLRNAERNTADPQMRRHLAVARRVLSQGGHLSEGFERAGGMPGFAIQVLRTAEQAGARGALGEVCAALRDHYRVHAEFRRKTRKALVQPMITASIGNRLAERRGFLRRWRSLDREHRSSSP